jgi:hypothetical protein
MAQPRHKDASTDVPGGDSVERMAQCGITCAHIDIYHYGGFRYTTLDDAIAEAERHPLGSRR